MQFSDWIVLVPDSGTDWNTVLFQARKWHAVTEMMTCDRSKIIVDVSTCCEVVCSDVICLFNIFNHVYFRQ